MDEKVENYDVQVKVELCVTKRVKAISFQDAISQLKNTRPLELVKAKAGVTVEWDEDIEVTGVFK